LLTNQYLKAATEYIDLHQSKGNKKRLPVIKIVVSSYQVPQEAVYACLVHELAHVLTWNISKNEHHGNIWMFSNGCILSLFQNFQTSCTESSLYYMCVTASGFNIVEKTQMITLPKYVLSINL
jgi:hypothetical protein